jgi:hypothetical protein
VRAPRALAAVAAAMATAALATGCSNDLTPVDAQRTVTCLQQAGQATLRLDPAKVRAPRAWGQVLQARGRTVMLSVRDARRADRRPWGFLVYFDGTKHAREAHDAYRGLPSGVRLASTRRQNVLVLFGRSGRSGIAPTGLEKRRLQSCFDQATS